LKTEVGRGVARIGGRLILASSGLIIALGLVLLAVAPNLPCFVLAWVVIGIGMAVVLGRIARPALIAQALTPLAGGICRSTIAQRCAMMVLGGLALINIVLVLMLLNQGRKTTMPNGTAST
jgi:uncharacterized membrane protein